MNFHVYKFSFLSSNWKVCLSKIGFSVTGQETEFHGDENSWFSHENSSPGWKENASHFIPINTIFYEYNIIIKFKISRYLNTYDKSGFKWFLAKHQYF